MNPHGVEKVCTIMKANPGVVASGSRKLAAGAGRQTATQQDPQKVGQLGCSRDPNNSNGVLVATRTAGLEHAFNRHVVPGAEFARKVVQ